MMLFSLLQLIQEIFSGPTSLDKEASQLSSNTTKVKPSVLLSVLDNYGGHPFDEVFDVVFPIYGPDEIEKALKITPKVAMVLWGGEDISPSIYNQTPNQFTGASENWSNRDRIEVKCAEEAQRLGVPIIGICRGAQLMCALSGGSLVQHVTGHGGGWHEIITNEGKKFNCPSLHHQMMYPWNSKGNDGIKEFEFIAWMETPKSKVYYGEPIKSFDKDVSDDEAIEGIKKLKLKDPAFEPEIIWIPRTKSLCIQSHPEFIHETSHPFVKYCNGLVRKYCLPT